MKTGLTIDKVGRLVLPKRIRTSLRVQPGDTLEAELRVGELVLRPVRMAAAHIVRVDGRAVWDAPGHTATAEEIAGAISRARDERDDRAGGI